MSGRRRSGHRHRLWLDEQAGALLFLERGAVDRYGTRTVPALTSMRSSAGGVVVMGGT